MAKLFVLSGSAIGSSFEFDGPALIGRATGVDVTLPEASVSREHARISPAGKPGAWRVVDLDSSNGLHFGGRRVTEAVVADGDTFTLGEIELRLRDDSGRKAGADSGVEDESGKREALELEFEGDLDEALSSAPKPSKPRESRPGGTIRTRAGARATEERAARRNAAVGRAASRTSAPGAVGSESGRPVLQYANTRSGGLDLEQLAGWQKLVLVVLALAVFVSIAYGAFALVSGARANP